jgi:hypothetical protein
MRNDKFQLLVEVPVLTVPLFSHAPLFSHHAPSLLLACLVAHTFSPPPSPPSCHGSNKPHDDHLVFHLFHTMVMHGNRWAQLVMEVTLKGLTSTIYTTIFQAELGSPTSDQEEQEDRPRTSRSSVLLSLRTYHRLTASPTAASQCAIHSFLPFATEPQTGLGRPLTWTQDSIRV